MAYFASELEFYLFEETYRSAARQGLAEPVDRLALYRGLSSSSSPPAKKR